jgi:hypothetical protein
MMVNPKGKDQFQVSSVENWMFFSNSHRPVEIERGDRRLAVFRTGGPIPPELGAQVGDDARAGGPIVRAFLAHLAAMPESELVPDYRPPETAAKEEIRAASGNSATKFAAEVALRGFWSVTGAWAVGGRGVRDLYLLDPHGAYRRIGEHSPVLTRRALMDVYRAFCTEIGAPAQQETTLVAALREEIPALVEAELAVDGRRERVLTNLPAAMPAGVLYAVAPPEQSGSPQQPTLF